VAFTPRSLVYNWRLKLSALGLSVLLWALVQSEPREAQTVGSVPVVVDVADTAWAASGPAQPGEVELRLSGPTGEIIRLSRAGTVLRVPIARVGSRDSLVTLRRDWVELGEGSTLNVESVYPTAVRISFGPAVTRVVPIALRTTGSLPSRLALASPIGLTPLVARVRGPTERVETLDSVLLRPLPLREIRGSGVIELAMDTAGLTGVHVSPATVTVGIRVEERSERRLSGIEVIAQAGYGRSSLTVSPEAVDVVLVGARTLLAAVDPQDVHAWVDPELLRDMEPGEERRVHFLVEGIPVLLTLDLPQEYVVVRRSPSDAPPEGT
jgi:YbbR domain-containing protein